MYYFIVLSNSPIYASSENWYIVSIKAKSLIMKNNLEAIFASFL